MLGNCYIAFTVYGLDLVQFCFFPRHESSTLLSLAQKFNDTLKWSPFELRQLDSNFENMFKFIRQNEGWIVKIPQQLIEQEQILILNFDNDGVRAPVVHKNENCD